MDNFLLFLLTLAVAAAGSILFIKLKLPAGALVGAIVLVVVLNLTLGKAFFYPKGKILVQICSGAMVGSRMGRRELAGMKKLPGALAILWVGVIVLNLVFGMSTYLLSPLDLATSLFATAPGGMNDMAIIASDLGANTGHVAILQLCRVLIIFIFMPPIIRAIVRKRAGKAPEAAEEKTAEKAQEKPPKLPFVPRIILLFVCAVAGGLLFYWLGVTSGAMVGAMVGSGVFSVLCWKSPFPKWLKTALQVFSGAYIGMRVTMETLLTMGDLIVPLIIMLVGIFIYTFSTAFIMHRLTKLELTTCLMASTPGGVQEMALLSEELGADTPKVALLQTCRLMFVVLVFPTMLKGIILLLG